MAILKHIAVKNADYGEAQRYLIFKHDEKTGKPVLDENGNMQFRDNYYLDGINCVAFTFDAECMEANNLFGKNQNYDDIKSHHYIISYDPMDAVDRGLTARHAQELGMEYAKKYFPGHQALVCTHTDGHNGSGNIHTHIVINSVRRYDVEREEFMERPCDSRAGFKHHLTKKHLAFLKQSVMDMCRRENLHQVDLLSPAKNRVTDKEYRLAQRGQKKMESQIKRTSAERPQQPAGFQTQKQPPQQPTKFQTQKQSLRDAVDNAARLAHSTAEFRNILFEKYGIILKESRGRFSYLHPERTKFITDRSLGALYKTDTILKKIAEKEIITEPAPKEKTENYRPADPADGQTSDIEAEQYTDTDEKAENHSREFHSSLPKPDNAFSRNAEKGGNILPDLDSVSILLVHSELRLVTDLQCCIKAQQSQAYAQKVKIANLKRMAETLTYIQEHGYDTREILENELADAKAKADSSRKSLKNTENRLKEVNEQIHYTGQYLANKSVYGQFLKAKNKGKFRQEHAAEITLYETAARFLKEKSARDASAGQASGKLPSLKLLKEEKEKLMKNKEARQETYRQDRDRQKELSTVCSNVNAILGQPARQKQAEKQKGQDMDIS